MNVHTFYNDFPTFLRRFFPFKVQKISLNAGFTCPNRDGTRGYGGCTYCNNQTFSPGYCHTEKPVRVQLEEGKAFFAHKYPEMKYLAYFQAYTNTYGELEELTRKYEEALAVDDVVGLVIGTRPDCMPPALLNYLEELSRRTFLLVEFGIESTLNRTLLRINRGHTWQSSVDAITQASARGILTGGHVILGLPGETRADILGQAKDISSLPLATLKLHQLQLEYIQRLRPDLVLERFVSQSPRELLIAPDWGLKNYEFNHRLQKRMKELGAYQGKLIGNP